ncbi:TRAM, LAG1 and CLN8 (TLC) lipid-sensing domain containing protein [Artemisia annua]|uniref:TRAM, LAG1 and CLN8 (TLC) lipid-sensing domain containing protein n=1 Tax=Artemisia annua TaxID=35608 RepID=A0A2U1MXS3_ARTAN|nr:TRAM, LAG1 and CLN8 (TLC) lipid-sensing domain containing protein [Artemisia annua]
MFTKVVFILVKQLSSNGIDEVFEHSQLVYATWPWAYSALCVSSGYFAYDQLDMLIYGLYSGWIPSILLHHFILLGCFTLALYRNVTINYLILTLICELHSIFLHVRKIRRMAGLRDGNSKFVKIEWFLNICTFLLARLLSHVLITAKLVKDASKFEKGIELPLALFGMAGMNLLNVFLASILSDREMMVGGGTVVLTILMLLVGRNSGMAEGTRVCSMQWKKQNSYGIYDMEIASMLSINDMEIATGDRGFDTM